MSTDDPRQVVIDYLSDKKFQREKRGCLAKVETILFLKVKALPNLHAYAVRYTSTTDQQWDEACLVQNMNGSWRCSSGFRGRTEDRFATTKEERVKNGSQPWIKVSATEESGYWFIYGNVIANNYDIASIRMVSATSGQIEEDETHDGLVLFLSKCSLPIEFEFYGRTPITGGGPARRS
jgi:hypothetical protein